MTESEIGTDERAHDERKHPESVPTNELSPPIATAIRTLIPSGRRTEIRALFDNRVSWPCIVQWRTGRLHMPRWARDMLASHIAAHTVKIAALGPAILTVGLKPPKGTAGTMALRRYRAQKAKGTP